ncbi:glycosyltransferase family 9 protein [Aestuariibacter sp. GS-14]|nr:glycosyltransferase family 9 protein [Aestuariibacter sp. GS-14]
MSPPSSTTSVLLVRLSSMGDIVMASGLPSNIKSRFPDANVTWLVESPYASLVETHPAIDNVIVWPRQHWRSLWKGRQYWQLFSAIRRFINTLRIQQFDIAIDAQGLLKSALFTWLSGAKQRIGFVSKERSHWLLTESVVKPLSPQISSEYRHLGQWLGATDYSLTLGILPEDIDYVNSLLQQHSIPTDYIAVAPFTTRPQKHWPVEHWKALLTSIASEGKSIVVLGGPAERLLAADLVNGIANCYVLAGELSMRQSAAAILLSRGLIGVDTGLTHMGTALLTNTIALFGSTIPYTQTDSSRTQVLFEAKPCSPCKRRPSCNQHFDCMKDLLPERVFEKVKQWNVHENMSR